MIILRMLMGRGWSQETTTMWTRTLEGSSTETRIPFTSSGKDREVTMVKDTPDDRVYGTGCAV